MYVGLSVIDSAPTISVRRICVVDDNPKGVIGISLTPVGSAPSSPSETRSFLTSIFFDMFVSMVAPISPCSALSVYRLSNMAPAAGVLLPLGSFLLATTRASVLGCPYLAGKVRSILLVESWRASPIDRMLYLFGLTWISNVKIFGIITK